MCIALALFRIGNAGQFGSQYWFPKSTGSGFWGLEGENQPKMSRTFSFCLAVFRSEENGIQAWESGAQGEFPAQRWHSLCAAGLIFEEEGEEGKEQDSYINSAGKAIESSFGGLPEKHADDCLSSQNAGHLSTNLPSNRKKNDFPSGHSNRDGVGQRMAPQTTRPPSPAGTKQRTNFQRLEDVLATVLQQSPKIIPCEFQEMMLYTGTGKLTP